MSKKSLVLLSFSLGICIALCGVCLLVFCHQESEEEKLRLKYYPLLQKSGRTLQELLKLDHVEEIYQMFTDDPKYRGIISYMTKGVETKIAEEALKEVINNSTDFDFFLREYHSHYVDNKQGSLTIEFTMPAVAVSSAIKTRLVETVDFKSDIQLVNGSGPLLLITKFIKLRPSGLTIVWESDDGDIYLHDSMDCTRWGYTDACPEFIDTLDSLLYQTMKDNLPPFLSRVDSQLENADESSKDAAE